MIWLILVVAHARNETQTDFASGRRLEWHKFSCHQGGAANVRVGFVVDKEFLARFSSKEDCEKKLRATGKKASKVYENNFGFGLAVEHVLFPEDLPSCSGLSGFATYSKKLKDKAVAFWVFWTACNLGAPGMAYLNRACTGSMEVCALTPDSDMILTHEIGHLFGAKHGTGRGAIMQTKHEYKGERGQFHEDHDREMCAVINKMKGKDRCWAKSTDTTPSSATPATPSSGTSTTPSSATPATPSSGTPATPSSGAISTTPPSEPDTGIAIEVIVAVVVGVCLLGLCFYQSKSNPATALPDGNASLRSHTYSRRTPQRSSRKKPRKVSRKAPRKSSRRALRKKRV